MHSHAVSDEELDRLCERDDRVGRVYRSARRISIDKAALIEERFPPLNRCLTGYDLAHLRDDDGRFNLNSVLCGAEGTLGMVVEARLNVLPIPRHAILVNIRYAGFMDALHDARALLGHHPLSIETVDSRVLLLAMQDIVWNTVAPYFPNDAEEPTLGINLVEFSGDDQQDVEARVAAFVHHLGRDQSVRRLGHTLARDSSAISHVYAMRKRAVGLLGNVQGEVRPQPFVEDTAVPPENLAAYIAEFRALLDSHGLTYGMFGHVDAGVLHVRPALDMKDPAHAALIRPISDAVSALTRKYGGLLWGEHGKGVRSEYVPEVFGELYPSLQTLKAAFDPHNQLNPGKIATPAGSAATLLKIDGVPLRGDADRTIDERVWQSYGTAVHCNGNGACYNFDLDDAMCPSWKATRQRIHSPNGRASLIREWLRLQRAAGTDVLSLQAAAQDTSGNAGSSPRSTPRSTPGSTPASAFASALTTAKTFPQRWRNSRAQRRGETDFSHEVHEAMSGCLACKSCAGQCPVKVNVPEFRSRFLALYHTRYLRPLKDYLIGSLEYTIPSLAKVPGATGVYNALMSSSVVRHWLEAHAGMVDSPLLSRFAWRRCVRQWHVQTATPERLAALSAHARSCSVILVQDAFTRYFETPVFAAFIELASRMGYQVFLAPFMPNGKPLQVQGFLGAFDRAARANAASLARLGSHGVPLVGLDPAMTLVYRQEYRKVEGVAGYAEVALPQEWLFDALSTLAGTPRAAPWPQAESRYRLMGHCTEKTNVPASTAQWQKVFDAMGLTLTAQASGCCGMSGTYGHEARNSETSKTIFTQSWGRILADGPAGEEFLATGYSCRSQAKRMRHLALRHPVQVLLERYRQIARSR
jgi:Fe-S oxidoreductase